MVKVNTKLTKEDEKWSNTKVACEFCGNDTFYAEYAEKEKYLYFDIYIKPLKLICTRCVKVMIPSVGEKDET
jgi:hypothetical protein